MTEAMNSFSPSQPTFIRSESIRAFKRKVILGLNAVATLGIFLGIYQLATNRVGWLEIEVYLLMMIISLIGITVGYHRYFSHRSFKTNRPIEIMLAIFGSMAGQGTLIAWVSVHRCHHQYSDAENDPHSPVLHGEGWKNKLQGLWHAHMGWLLDDRLPNSMLFAKDILQDPLLVRISRLYFFWLALGFLFPALLGWWLSGTWRGAIQGLIWGGFIRFAWSFHGGYTINSIAHVYGKRWLRSKDKSRNNFWLALLTFGEGWHNNHHAFPNSSKFGLKWWQIDMGYWFIYSLTKLGLIHDCKMPTPEMIEAKRLSIAPEEKNNKASQIIES